MHLTTDRLVLRRWREEDLEPFAAMSADPEVMEFFPSALTREESDGLALRLDARFDEHGFSFCAVELRASGEFIGFVGLNVPSFKDLPFMPAVEVGWRLGRPYWGHGYATEGGRACLAYGFDHLDLDEIVAWAVADNHRSRRVMERIGMVYDPTSDFEYDYPPRPQVVYRVRRIPALPL